MTFQIAKYPGDMPIRLVALFALLALIDSLFNYFWTGNGIHGSEGALLVIVSTLLMTLAAGAFGSGWVRGCLKTVLEVLIVLDFLGTALAAYFLEAWILLALMVLGFIAWVIHLTRPSRPVASLG
jgi:hypothetical protein